VHADDDAALQRHVAPSRAGEVEHLLDEGIQGHASVDQFRLARPVELAHSRDGGRDVVDRAGDGLQRVSRPRAQRFALQQVLRVQRHRRDRVVDVVRDAAGHLAERPQPLLLQDGLLRLAQVVVGALQ